MMRGMRKLLLILLAVSAVLIGCRAAIQYPAHPLRIAELPEKLPENNLSIGIFAVSGEIQAKNNLDRDMLKPIVKGMQQGMIEACRLFTSNVTVLGPGQTGDFDILLIPTNPYIDISESALGTKTTLSVDVNVQIRGNDRERGFLVEAEGYPGPLRPASQLTVLGITYGLTAERIGNTRFERSLNATVFQFSLEFAKRLEKQVQKALIYRETMK